MLVTDVISVLWWREWDIVSLLLQRRATHWNGWGTLSTPQYKPEWVDACLLLLYPYYEGVACKFHLPILISLFWCVGGATHSFRTSRQHLHDVPSIRKM